MEPIPQAQPVLLRYGGYQLSKGSCRWLLSEQTMWNGVAKCQNNLFKNIVGINKLNILEPVQMHMINNIKSGFSLQSGFIFILLIFFFINLMRKLIAKWQRYTRNIWVQLTITARDQNPSMYIWRLIIIW